MSFKKKITSLLLLSSCVLMLSNASANEKEFVSTKTNESYLRAGPSKNYPIKWVVKNRGEPLKVIAEFENWRKVKDFSGDTGWVHASVVSTTRYGIVNAGQYIILYKSDSEDSKKILKLESGVRLRLMKCKSEWCKVQVSKLTGWVKSSEIWGDVNS